MKMLFAVATFALLTWALSAGPNDSTKITMPPDLASVAVTKGAMENLGYSNIYFVVVGTKDGQESGAIVRSNSVHLGVPVHF